jgi:hypothetical protein
VIQELSPLTSKHTLHLLPNEIDKADPGSRAVYGVGLRPLTCWDCGFESRQWYRCVACDCCVLSGRGLRLADHSSTGVLPICECVCVCLCHPEIRGREL